MSAEILRRAAQTIRLEHPNAYAEPFHSAVADLLDAVAARADEVAGTLVNEKVLRSIVRSNVTGYSEALAAANAYLNSGAPRGHSRSGTLSPRLAGGGDPDRVRERWRWDE